MLTKNIKYLISLVLTTIFLLIIFKTIKYTSLKDETIDSETLSQTIFQDYMLTYSEIPWLNEEFKIKIEEKRVKKNKSSKFIWSVIKEPKGSQLKLLLSEDMRKISLTAKIAGEYKIKIVDQAGKYIETEFTIEKVFPFDIKQLGDYNKSKDISEISSIVTNQFWVYSKQLHEYKLREILSKYQKIKVIGYDDTHGLLIEFNGVDLKWKSYIKKLLLEKGIDGVYKRIYEGRNFIHSMSQIPDDGSAFDDGGDNWHLEYIHMNKAWDISTGSNEFYIGVGDSGNYALNHEDLRGRFKEAISHPYREKSKNHGTEVSGAIAAISNNKKGISGINWISEIVATVANIRNLENLINKEKVFLVNNSWTIMINYVDENFNPEELSKSIKQKNIAYDQTRSALNIVKRYDNKLFVWSAGNGVGNGTSKSGVYGVESKYSNPALHYSSLGVLDKRDNVIFVAAVLNDDNLAYYSTYGEGVDIAAPTGFKSTMIKNKYNTGSDYGGIGIRAMFGGVGFSGTSAAAPVVTGVASLIYSVDTSFTAAEVKKILIKSASKFVTQRYVDPFGEKTENLRYKIPIVDAGSALKMAKEIKEGTRDRNTMEYRPIWDRIDCDCKQLPYVILSFFYLFGLIYKGKFCRNQRIEGVVKTYSGNKKLPKRRLKSYVPWWQWFIPYKAEWIHYQGMLIIADTRCNTVHLSRETQVGISIEMDEIVNAGTRNIKIYSGSFIAKKNEEYFLS